MITRIFYGVGFGLLWALSLMLMGVALRLMVELFQIGWNLWP